MRLRTDVTPRLHHLEGLLDVSNTCDRRLPRTLPAHLSGLNRVRHALIGLTAGQQILVSSDLTSRCLGLIVYLVETLDVILLLVDFSILYRLKQRLIDH